MSDFEFIENICANASRFSLRPAVVHKGQTATYAELIAGATEIATAISSAEVPGQPKIIVINLANSIRLVELILGCLIARVCFVLALSEAEVLANMNAFPDALLINEQTKIVPPKSQTVRLLEKEPVVIFSSSGTSGAPKSVAHAYGSLNVLARELSQKLVFDSSDRSLVCMSMLLPFCLTSQVLPALLSGSTLVVKDRYDGNDVLHSIAHEGVTRIYLHGRSYIELLALRGERTENQLRSCVAGGELCPPSINRAFGKQFGLHVIQSMGMSETLAHSLNTNEDLRKLGSAGLPLCGAKISIEDASGFIAQKGEPGEIVVETPVFMRTHSAMESGNAGSPFRTGDLGYVDEDGYLWFLGRKSTQRNVNALREVQRLNSALFEIDGVADAFVQRNQNSELVAFVCLSQGHSKDIVSNEILKLVGNQQATINYLAALPKLPTGKMNTGLLAQIAND